MHHLYGFYTRRRTINMIKVNGVGKLSVLFYRVLNRNLYDVLLIMTAGLVRLPGIGKKRQAVDYHA